MPLPLLNPTMTDSFLIRSISSFVRASKNLMLLYNDNYMNDSASFTCSDTTFLAFESHHSIVSIATSNEHYATMKVVVE